MLLTNSIHRLKLVPVLILIGSLMCICLCSAFCSIQPTLNDSKTTIAKHHTQYCSNLTNADDNANANGHNGNARYVNVKREGLTLLNKRNLH